MAAAGLLFLGFQPSIATAQCPVGFLDAGELSALGATGNYQVVTVTKDLLLPKGIRLDSPYRQKSIQAASDGGASDMRAVQIPAGIHLIPGGGGRGGWWSINNPKLEAALTDGQNVTQWKFTIDLYANSGRRGSTQAAARYSAPAPPNAARSASDGTGVGVRVRVCVKAEL